MRAGEKKKMYEVFCWVKTVSDVDHFLEEAEKFSKRFYTVMYKFDDEHEKHWIFVEAIAISRNLVSILRWSIPCDYDRNKDPDLQGEDDTKRELPPHGYIPTDADFASVWFPCAASSYVNVFEYCGFHIKSEIKTDWNTKSLSDRW